MHELLRFLLHTACPSRLLLGLFLAWTCAAAGAQPAPQLTLRIVGGLANINQYTRSEEPFWRDELPRLSGGRYAASIAPFDRAGVPGEDMARLIRLGVVPFGTVLFSFLGKTAPNLVLADLAGLNLTMAELRQTVAASRPYLAQELRQRHNMELLALYVYPAQVVFCKAPFTRLAELKGRRVRTSSQTQSDLMHALGAEPVATSFSQIVPNITSGNIDCAITGTMSGYTIGLHEVTHTIHTLPITWGLAVFAAHRNAWEALPADLRQLLAQELPKLEARIWAESERETSIGLACNTGSASCAAGKPGRMVAAPALPEDERLLRTLFQTQVLPAWMNRCGEHCQTAWNQTLAPVRAGIPRGAGTP